jgi:hypothetical protein
MLRFALVCTSCVAVLAACSGGSSQKAAADSAAAAAAAPPAPPPAPPALSFNDVAGKWDIKVMNEAGDSTLLTETMNATADGSGWTIIRGKLKPEPVRPTVSGDSLITEGGPYPSALRKGVKVTTHTVWHMQNGKLMGVVNAHYSVKTADSTRTLHVEGTRAQ